MEELHLASRSVCHLELSCPKIGYKWYLRGSGLLPRVNSKARFRNTTVVVW